MQHPKPRNLTQGGQTHSTLQNHSPHLRLTPAPKSESPRGLREHTIKRLRVTRVGKSVGTAGFFQHCKSTQGDFMTNHSNVPFFPVARLKRETSESGNTYFTGRWGGARVLVVK